MVIIPIKAKFMCIIGKARGKSVCFYICIIQIMGIIRLICLRGAFLSKLSNWTKPIPNTEEKKDNNNQNMSIFPMFSMELEIGR